MEAGGGCRLRPCARLEEFKKLALCTRPVSDQEFRVSQRVVTIRRSNPVFVPGLTGQLQHLLQDLGSLVELRSLMICLSVGLKLGQNQPMNQDLPGARPQP